MSYKESFVDEFPYLTYSDDPSAVNGAGGDSVAIDFIDGTTEMMYFNNKSTRMAFPVFILADADGSKFIANMTLNPIQGSTTDGFTVSEKAYFGLISSMMPTLSVKAYVTATGETIDLEPVGTREGNPALTIFAGDPAYNSIDVYDKS